MKEVKIIEAFQQMEGLLESSLKRLKKARKEVKENENKIYWMTISLNNNREKFTDTEIEKVEALGKEFGELTDSYDKIIKFSKETITGFDKAIQKMSANEMAQLDILQETVNVEGLYEKMDKCLEMGEKCMETQKRILQEMGTLEYSLQR
jgi:phosphohistidine swiveling domain-containing protein